MFPPCCKPRPDKPERAAADTAQAILVTLWNAAMALGGLIGGLLLQGSGSTAVATAAAALGAISLLIVAGARRHAFPAAWTTPDPRDAQ